MITNAQKYSEFKESGSVWLGKIPRDWDVFPFKKIFKLSNERVENIPSIHLALSVSGYRGVEPRDIDTFEGQMPSEDIGKYRIVRKGQLAVNTMWLNYVGLGVSDYEGYISPAYRSYNIDRVMNRKFAHYLLRSSLYVQKYTSMLYGLRPNSLQIKNYDFEKIEILVPPYENQQRIADFLDEKTKIIDELVVKKGRLVELLKEKRVAFISRVVTKGLNPNAKFKPSGTKWLDDIPDSWRVVKIKHIVDESIYYPIGDGDHGSITPEMYLEEGIPYIRVQNLSWGFNLNSEGLVYISEETHKKNLKSRLRPKDLLIAKTGATIGKIAIIPTTIPEANTTSSVGKITVSPFVDHRFIGYVLLSKIIHDQIWTVAEEKSAQPGFNIDDLVLFTFALPSSIDDQKKIADFLDCETGKMDRAIQKITEQIEKLKEYLSALIYAAVTGKVKI